MKVITAQRLLRSKSLFPFAFLFAVLGLVSCDSQGPAEEAGVKVDQVAE